MNNHLRQIWVVMRHEGAYSDHEARPVGVVPTLEAAKQAAEYHARFEAMRSKAREQLLWPDAIYYTGEIILCDWEEPREEYGQMTYWQMKVMSPYDYHLRYELVPITTHVKLEVTR